MFSSVSYLSDGTLICLQNDRPSCFFKCVLPDNHRSAEGNTLGTHLHHVYATHASYMCPIIPFSCTYYVIRIHLLGKVTVTL